MWKEAFGWKEEVNNRAGRELSKDWSQLELSFILIP